MEAVDIIKNRIKELREQYDRMNKTAKFVHLEPYELLQYDGKTAIRNVANVRPNRAATFMFAMVEDLIGSKWQTVIEGKITTEEAHVIEQFIDDGIAQADEVLLRSQGIPRVHDWVCNHVCARGPIGVRLISGNVKGLYTIDALPVDMRWVPYEFGDRDSKWLDWACNITKRSKGWIEKEYPREAWRFSYDKIYEVWDYWDGDKNKIYIAEEFIKERKNKFGYPPFVIAIPPVGFMLRDEGWEKYDGEDALFLIRGLLDEDARRMTIEQTLGMNLLFPARVRPVKDYGNAEDIAIPMSNEEQTYPEGELPELLPQADMSNVSMAAREDFSAMLDEGGRISPTTYTSPPSAILIATEEEIKGKVLNSRLETLGVFRSQLARMMIDQFIKADEHGEVGVTGKRTKYTVSQLKDPGKYSIRCQLMTKSKRQELANLAQFAAVYDKLPLKINLRDVLIADDPDEIIRELELERAKQADPALALHEMALRYVEEADDIEDDEEANAKLIQAKMLVERGVSIIKQRMASPVEDAPEVEQPKGNGNLLPALIGRG